MENLRQLFGVSFLVLVQLHFNGCVGDLFEVHALVQDDEALSIITGIELSEITPERIQLVLLHLPLGL